MRAFALRRVARISDRFRRTEGQALIIVVLCLVVILGITGLVVDVGQLHSVQSKLQTAANAAALAAGDYLPNTGAINAGCTYSASLTNDQCNGVAQTTDGANSYTSLPGVTTSVEPECLSTASAGIGCATGTECPAPPTGPYLPPYGSVNDVAGCNAVKVTETTQVTPWFMGVLGFGAQTVTATATASSAGGVPHPLDVEIVDDTTESMQTSDTCGGTPTDVPSSAPLTQEDCAKAGIRALLGQLLPCSVNLTSCGPDVADTDNVSNPVDEVGMVTFPGLVSSGSNAVSTGSGLGIPDELDCTKELGSNNVTYTNNPNFQVVPFSSDFRISDAPTTDPLATLNPASNLVRSVFWRGDGCTNGGYPISGSGPASSISGGGPGHESTATTSTTGIGGGAGTPGDTSTAVNSGIAQNGATTATNTSTTGVVAGNSQANTSTPTAIGGGPNAGFGNTNSTDANGVTGITINRPFNKAANDFLLATITAQGSGVTSSSNICPTTATSGWTAVDQRISGTLIQATYSSIRSSAAAESYTFNFFSGACGGGAGNLTLNASAVVLRYTNVSAVQASTGTIGAPSTTNFAGSAGSTAWTQTTGTYGGSTIASAQYTNTPRYISFSSTNSCTTAAACDMTVGAGITTITNPTFTFTGVVGVGRGNSYTVTLLINDAPAAGGTCTIDNFTGPACTITGSWAVTGASSTISLEVTGGVGSSLTTTATATVNYSGGSSTNYVSLSSACVSTTVNACDVTTITAPGTLTSAGLSFGTTVPTGDHFLVTLLRNGASTGSACTIGIGTATESCTVAPNLTVATGNDLELEVTQTAGTAAFASTAATSAVEAAATVLTTLPLSADAGDQGVFLFGTASTGFTAGNGLPLTVASTSTATGADDESQTTNGTTGTESVTSSTPADWVAQTVVLSPTVGSTISVEVPSGYAPTGNDLLLVTVAVQGLGTGVICAPDNTWTPVTLSGGNTVSSGTLTQEAFWTMTSTGERPATDTFSFETKCTGGTPIPAGASIVAVNYTGVDGTTPFDDVAANVEATAAQAAASPLAPAAVTTHSADDEVVSLFATNASALTVTNGGGVQGVAEDGSWTSGGVTSQSQAVPATVTPSNATSNPTGANWSDETLALRAALLPSITITPSGYASGSGDLLLVSIAVQNLGSGVICRPDANWHSIGLPTQPAVDTVTSGTLTQESFWTALSTAYTFTFATSCGGGGTAVEAGATAVAIDYTGVDLATAPQLAMSGGGLTGTALTAPQDPTPSADNEVVSLFATNASTLTLAGGTVQDGNFSSSGGYSQFQPAAGNQPTSQTATAGSSTNWTAETVDLAPLLNSSITITPPSGYAPGDLLLVSIGVEGLGTAHICAPDNTWTPVVVGGSNTVTSGSGSLTQETFWTTSSEGATDTFTFYPGASCAGTPVDAGASAVAVNYTGVNTSTPFDGAASAAPAANSGSTSPLTPNTVTTSLPGDEVVSLFATAAGTLTVPPQSVVSTGGYSTSSGAGNALISAANTTTTGVSGSATSTPMAAPWTTETLALSALSNTGITIARPPNPVANDFVLVTVTAQGFAAGDNICAPNDRTWSEAGSTTVQGSLGQATFYSFRPTADPENYTFTFQSGACYSGGAPVTATATALADEFSGVNPLTPIDAAATVATGSTDPTVGDSTSLAPPGMTPGYMGDELVAFYGSATTSLTVKNGQSTSGSATSTGVYATAPPTGQSTTPPASTIAKSNWIGQTIMLLPQASSCASSCEYGLEDPGGAGTNYAAAIYAAQNALVAQAASRPTAQKVIILLSDGQANTESGLPYSPDTDPCQQGVAAAENAESAGTWVFTIAYGSTAPGGCDDDRSAFDGGGVDVGLSGISADCAMILMANNPVTNPYSAANPNGYTSNAEAATDLCGNSVAPSDPAHKYYSQAPENSLEQVFTSIGEALSSPRLLSNEAT